MFSNFTQTGAVTPYGALFVAALLTCWWLARRRAQAFGLHSSHVDLALPIAVLGGIGGGLLLAMLPTPDTRIAGEALTVAYRIRLFGFILGGAFVLFVYSRLGGLSFRALLDAFALPTLAAIAVIRVGCFFTGCCWGDLSIFASIPGDSIGLQLQTLPWLAGDWVRWSVVYGPGTWPFEQQLAIGLIGPDADGSLPVHPVQLYEATLLLAAYVALRRLPPGKWQPGAIAVAATLSYLLIRFPLEFLRADGAIIISGLTLVQLQSVALAVMLLTVVRLTRHGHRYAR